MEKRTLSKKTQCKTKYLTNLWIYKIDREGEIWQFLVLLIKCILLTHGNIF